MSVRVLSGHASFRVMSWHEAMDPLLSGSSDVARSSQPELCPLALLRNNVAHETLLLLLLDLIICEKGSGLTDGNLNYTDLTSSRATEQRSPIVFIP